MNMQTKQLMMVAAALTAGTGLSDVLFQENFRNYSDKAPGVTAEGFDVINDPIHSRHAFVRAKVEKDAPVFLKDVALPKDGRFDVLFTYAGGATNSAMDVVFKLADGRTAVLPVTGRCGTREYILKAANGTLDVYNEQKRVFSKTASIALKEAVGVNFIVREGAPVDFSDLVVRTPAALPDYAALNQFAAPAVLNRALADAKTSDGAPLAALGKSFSFVPGATGVVGKVTIEYANGEKGVFPITVGDQTYRSRVPSYGMPDLGIDNKQLWHGPDAVIKLVGEDLFVRPHLKPFANYRSLSKKGIDLVRDWAALPPASKHVTTVEFRAADGDCQLWIDGSYVKKLVKSVRKGKDQPNEVFGVKDVTIEFAKGVKYRENALPGNGELELWANPRAKAFADAAPDSADVALAHYAQCGYGLDQDGYTDRNPLDGYPGAVHFRLPSAPYTRAVIDFVLDNGADKVDYLACRIARYHYRGGTGCTSISDVDLDYEKGLPAEVKKVSTLKRGNAELPVYRVAVTLPIGKQSDYLFADARGVDWVDLEFLGPKEDNLQQADNTQKPREDVSSSFNLLAVRLEKLDVLPAFVQAARGNVFTADEKVKTTAVRLTALVDGAKGTLAFGDRARYDYAFDKAGETKEFTFDFSDADVGLYFLPIAITDKDGHVFTHDARYCVTPEAGRLATKEESPYSTWWFDAHGSPRDESFGGPVMQKAGIRKCAAHRPSKECCERYDITSSGFIYAPKLRDYDPATGELKGGKIKKDGKLVEVGPEEYWVDNIQKQIDAKPFVDHVMIWHESAPNCGIPEEIIGLAAPTNDVEREKLMGGYINACGRFLRKHFPQLKIQIGNSNASIGAATVPFRGGAKPEYVDQIGMEIPSQTILPERLFDFGFLGVNIAKAAAKATSGKDIPGAGCYEFCYRVERDMGWKGEDAQAEFHARDILVSLMNGYALISPGLLFDCRNAYCNTLWGVSGILLREPYVYPKKAYLMYAVMTKVMDGAKFSRVIPTGSPSVFAVEFVRKDGRYATAFWCARGEAQFKVEAKGELWTMYGKRSSVGGWFSDAEFTSGTAPSYLVSAKPCGAVTFAKRTYADDAVVVSHAKPVTVFRATDLEVAPDPEMESKHHNFLPYMKPGVFTVKDVEDEEEGPCVEVTLDVTKKLAPITEFVTEYTTLRFKTPIEIPGKPGVLGLKVKGNSNQGQLRFEIEDAKGEVFKGLTTGKSWGCDVFDWPGYLAVTFDGWADVYQYTDRNPYDMIVSPGPRIEQWVSGGGDKKITYPVKLRAVTVPMNRYTPTILGFEETKPSLRLKSVWYAE